MSLGIDVPPWLINMVARNGGRGTQGRELLLSVFARGFNPATPLELVKAAKAFHAETAWSMEVNRVVGSSWAG